MAYFALIVPNTALAKSAATSWWSQGFTYLWNFVAPYTLWLPFALAIPIVLPRLVRWWRNGDRTGVTVLITPVAMAAVDVGYVARIGGDYQHARLLLPGFLALCLPIFVSVRQLRSLLIVPVVSIIAWSVACAGWLRFSTGGILSSDHGIVDERAFWIAVSKSPHPISAADYHNQVGGFNAATAARARRQGSQLMMVNTELAASNPGSVDIQPARASLPYHLAVSAGAIGVTGYLSGPDVYIFDTYSLANPIGSHFVVTDRGRPGHQKFIGVTWMIARFGTPGTVLPVGASPGSVAADRLALACDPLHSYLHAITAPLGVSQAFSNITHALANTQMTVPAQPDPAKGGHCR
jgi:arabinofuranosyltransferase